MPSGWVCVSTTKDLSRYHTPKILSLMRRLLQTREEVQLAGEQAWTHFVASVDESCYQDLRTLLSALASFDA